MLFPHASDVAEHSSQISVWIIPAVSAVGAIIGGILGGYFVKWGEIRAIQGKLDTVINQNAQITKANETIKANIDREIWGERRAWELRKEVAFRMMECMGILRAAGYKLFGVNYRIGASVETELHRTLRDTAYNVLD